MRYRFTVLEPGGIVSANDLVRNSYAGNRILQSFQKSLGEEFDDYGRKAGQLAMLQRHPDTIAKSLDPIEVGETLDQLRADFLSVTGGRALRARDRQGSAARQQRLGLGYAH